MLNDAGLAHRLADLLHRVDGHAVDAGAAAAVAADARDDLHVLEALVREPRRERLRPGALGDVVVGLDLARRREAGDADQPVRAELLGVADLDRRAGGRAADLDRRPAGALLAGVPHVHAAGAARARARPGTCRSATCARRSARAACRPGRSTVRAAAHAAASKPGAFQPAELRAGVVGLAEVVVVVADRARGARPSTLSSDLIELLGAVRVLDVEVGRAASGSRATRRSTSPSRPRSSRCRTGRSRAARRSRSRPPSTRSGGSGRDVVGRVQDGLVVAREAGVEERALGRLGRR